MSTNPHNRPGQPPPPSTMAPTHMGMPELMHMPIQMQHTQHHIPHYPTYMPYQQQPPPSQMPISPVESRKRRRSEDSMSGGMGHSMTPGQMPGGHMPGSQMPGVGMVGGVMVGGAMVGGSMVGGSMGGMSGVMSGQPTTYPNHHESYMSQHVKHESPMQISTPPTKKSRVNTPWTPEEEHRLKQMRDASHSWGEIAKAFPLRTEGSVKKHWYKDMHYAEFAEDESAALLAAIKEYDANKWKAIGQKVGKPAKACEQYAKEHFSKDQLSGKG